MPLECGIVGLPNVGKSTLFNAITNTAQAQSANYPFCTIEPNKASVIVPDKRLSKLASIENSEALVPETIEIVDIAGLVRGASAGDGLGNQFLENIRQVDAIIHVVRCFVDDNIIHVENSVNPIRDIEIINTELLLSDVSRLAKYIQNNEKKVNTKDPKVVLELEVAKKLYDVGNNGLILSSVKLEEDEEEVTKRLHLLTKKPMLYVANVAESNSQSDELYKEIVNIAAKQNAEVIKICASAEAEMISFSAEEKEILLEDLSGGVTALNQLIRKAYQMLSLITFFTVGPKEVRAWSVKKGSFASQAAGVIHTDFERGFIKAETIAYDDFIEFKGTNGAKNNGKFRTEGKDYLVKEGDIFHFRFNV